MAIRPNSGSSTSPMPVMMSEVSRSATASIASRRRSTRSVRQSLASSTAERSRLPWCFFQLGLETLEQSEGVGCAAGESGQDTVVVQAPHLARAGLDHDVTERPPGRHRPALRSGRGARTG